MVGKVTELFQTLRADLLQHSQVNIHRPNRLCTTFQHQYMQVYTYVQSCMETTSDARNVNYSCRSLNAGGQFSAVARVTSLS